MVLRSPFSWQSQKLRWWTLTFITFCRVVALAQFETQRPLFHNSFFCCRIDEDGFQTSFDASSTAVEEKFGNQQTGFWDPIGRFQKFWLQVSRNVPINFLTRPDKSAFNLVLALGFVSCPYTTYCFKYPKDDYSRLISYLNIQRQALLLRTACNIWQHFP